MFDNHKDIDAYLDGLLNSDSPSLQELFNKKIKELEIFPTTAFNIMKVEPRSMKGILSGSKKLINVKDLLALANFLQLSLEQVTEMYIRSVEKNFQTNGVTAEEISFIKKNFNLAGLKKAGLIDNISDFNHIKKRISSRLGIRSIYEYKKPKVDVAFSSGLLKPETDLDRAFWINAALATLSEIKNPNAFDREALINLFPQISWYSTNVERGLLEVSKLLYKIGITVIYQPPISSLQLRGATFSHNDKPAIILTNYRNFYATLWFALIHELYHVLFDWPEIKANKYHLSDDSNEQLSVQEREREADNFAREYLFPQKKMEYIRPHLNNYEYIKQYGHANHVDPSIIYVFHAFESKSSNRAPWAKARKYSPDTKNVIKPLDLSWTNRGDIEEIVPEIAINTYT